MQQNPLDHEPRSSKTRTAAAAAARRGPEKRGAMDKIEKTIHVVRQVESNMIYTIVNNDVATVAAAGATAVAAAAAAAAASSTGKTLPSVNSMSKHGEITTIVRPTPEGRSTSGSIAKSSSDRTCLVKPFFKSDTPSPAKKPTQTSDRNKASVSELSQPRLLAPPESDKYTLSRLRPYSQQ